MIRLDTLKIKTNSDAIKDINYNYFDQNVKYISGCDKPSQITYKLPKEMKAVGLNNIIIYGETSDEIIIEVSGKILKDHYYELLNKNTIFQGLENINLKAISFDPYKLLEAEILKTDITNNIKVENDIKKYIQAITLLSKGNYKYLASKYKNYGIVFVKNNITPRLKYRLIFYNKPVEMIKDKRIMKYIKIEDFLNVLRVESNLKNKAQIRKRLGYEDKQKHFKLGEILENKENVNLDHFNEIVKDTPEVMKYGMNSVNENMKQYYYNHILKDFGYDMKKAREFIKSLVNENTSPSYHLKQLRDYTQKETGNENEYIQEIKEKLKKS